MRGERGELVHHLAHVRGDLAVALDDVVEQDPDEPLLDARGEVRVLVANGEQIGEDVPPEDAERRDVLHRPRRGHRVVVIRDWNLARHRAVAGTNVAEVEDVRGGVE